MDGPLENDYFKWLCSKVMAHDQPRTPSLTHWNLLKILHSTEFVWTISGDDNRAEDGIELRYEFIVECNLPYSQEWKHMPCSILEMLIAFSRRAEFNTGVPAREWFWEFLDNLNLKECNDGSSFKIERVELILDRFIWRTYHPNGDGGLFPLKDPRKDQRKVEIWYQFCSYLVDQNRLP